MSIQINNLNNQEYYYDGLASLFKTEENIAAPANEVEHGFQMVEFSPNNVVVQSPSSSSFAQRFSKIPGHISYAVIQVAKSVSSLVTSKREPFNINKTELSDANLEILSSIIQTDVNAFRKNMQGYTESQSAVSRAFAGITSLLPVSETVGARIGENLAIQYTATAIDAGLTAYMFLWGPQHQIVKALTKETMRMMYSREIYEKFMRPLGIKAGILAIELAKQTGSAVVNAAAQALTQKTITHQDLERSICDFDGQSFNQRREALTENDISAVSQMITKVHFIDKLFHAKRGEIQSIFNLAYKARSDGEQVWLDGSFVRPRENPGINEAKKISELKKNLFKFGIRISPDDHKPILEAAVSILERTNPDAHNTEETVKDAFKLIAYFTTVDIPANFEAKPYIVCEDGATMDWNSGRIVNSKNGVKVEDVSNNPPAPPPKEPYVEEA